MNFDPSAFRLMYPEFADKTKYPDAMLEMYWDLATVFVSTEGCPCGSVSGKQRQAILNMLTAHLLALSTQAQGDGSTPGGSGGSASAGGYETSSHIGEISVSRMAPPATDGWQFWLAQTPYGQQLWALLGLLAVGGFAIGGLPERTGFRKIGGVFL
jgi:hypothetical protein